MRKTIQKLTAVLVLFGIITGMTACSKENPFKNRSQAKISGSDEIKVNMTVEVVSNRKVTVNIENKSDCSLMYGRLYELEYKYEGEWYEVPVDRIFTAEGIVIGPYEEDDAGADDLKLSNSSSDDVDLIEGLPEGHYRMIKDITLYEGEIDGEGRDYSIAGEFDLDKAE